MLTPQATIAEASARDGLHTARTLLVRGFTRARAGQVTKSLEDLTAVHADSDARLTDLERAALLTTGIDCRLARGELALALSLGEELDPSWRCPAWPVPPPTTAAAISPPLR